MHMFIILIIITINILVIIQVILWTSMICINLTVLDFIKTKILKVYWSFDSN